jgi:hypothetical protein
VLVGPPGGRAARAGQRVGRGGAVRAGMNGRSR